MSFLTVLSWFLILGTKSKVAAKMTTIVGDVTGLLQQYHPWNIPHLVKKIEGFPLKLKSFQKTATYQKLRGGVSFTHLPPFTCTTVGVWICMYVRGLSKTVFLLKQEFQNASPPDKTVYDTERGSYFASYNSFTHTRAPVVLMYCKINRK